MRPFHFSAKSGYVRKAVVSKARLTGSEQEKIKPL